MTPDESTLLLYFETCAVDYGGTFEARRVSPAELDIAKRWQGRGYIRFGRLSAATCRRNAEQPRPATHWVQLSERAWKDAHRERRLRHSRMEPNAQRRHEWIGDYEEVA